MTCQQLGHAIHYVIDVVVSIGSTPENLAEKSQRLSKEVFGKEKEDYRTIRSFLVFMADKKKSPSNSEYRKVAHEVDDVSIGKYKQAQKQGNLIK